MHLIPEAIADQLPLVIAFLFCVVFFRAQATYWLGRAAAKGALWGKEAGGIRGAIGGWFNGPVPQKGVRILERWGLIIVPLCFLTVGIQTVVNAGAGLVQLRWIKYTLLMLPGCLAWALMYAFGLAAAWSALLSAFAGSIYAWLALVVVVVLVGGFIHVFRRHRAAVAHEDSVATHL